MDTTTTSAVYSTTTPAGPGDLRLRLKLMGYLSSYAGTARSSRQIAAALEVDHRRVLAEVDRLVEDGWLQRTPLRVGGTSVLAFTRVDSAGNLQATTTPDGHTGPWDHGDMVTR